jgi:hypothetical protein
MIDIRNLNDNLPPGQRRFFTAEKEFGLVVAAILLAADPPRSLAPEIGRP